MFRRLQKSGKTFMLPIAIPPAADLPLGIGGALSSPSMMAAYPLLNVFFLQALFRIISTTGSTVLASLSMIVCIDLAADPTKGNKEAAGLAMAVAFLAINATIGASLTVFNPEGSAISTGAAGTIVIGCTITWLRGQYHNIQFPQFLGFFGGSRFTPTTSSFLATFIGVLSYIIWPLFQGLLVNVEAAIAGTGAFGTFLYGSLVHLCDAVGLHHMIYPMFRYTELDGATMVAGGTIAGVQKIFFTELADPNLMRMFAMGTRFFTGHLDTMIFGLPGAALAMYHYVPGGRQKLVGSLLFPTTLTSFLTGITEPPKFMFLFVTPWLCVVHAFLGSISFAITDLLSIRIGNTFSDGFIDFAPLSILQENAETRWLYMVVMGVFQSALYCFSPRFLTTEFNVVTPSQGNDDDEANMEVKGTTAEPATRVLTAPGGKEDAEDYGAYITRLGVAVCDVFKVDKEAIKVEGAMAVPEVEGGIWAVFGAKADLTRDKTNGILEDD